jgi:hypothetical protein
MLSESLPTESLVDAWPMLEIDACEDTGGQYNFAIEFLRPKDPLSRKVLSACTLKKEAVDNPVLGKNMLLITKSCEPNGSKLWERRTSNTPFTTDRRHSDSKHMLKL